MIIDTHAHLDVEDFADDLPEVISRAREAGVGKIFLPAIDQKSIDTVLAVCRQYPDICYPMIGLQPEEVCDDWREVLDVMHERILQSVREKAEGTALPGETVIAIGEVGLDFYWTREYEKQQLAAFEEAVKWSVETRLPLMIHCRKAQNEMLHIMRPYAKDLPGGVFHCFTGNQKEAEAFLCFDRFMLGIGAICVRTYLQQYHSTASSLKPIALIWLLFRIVANAMRVPSSLKLCAPLPQVMVSMKPRLPAKRMRMYVGCLVLNDG